MKELKILIAFCLITGCSASNRGIEQRLEELIFRIEQSESTNSYTLGTQKFVLQKGATREILNFQPEGKLSLYKIQDGGSQTRLWQGDYERRDNFVSVVLEREEGRVLEIPLVKNMMLAKYQDMWLLVDINNQDKWIEQTFVK